MDHTTPLPLLRQWIDNAVEAGFPTPANATLATVDSTGQPSARVVTIREITDEVVRFATTLYTRKARDIQANPNVSLLLFWPGAGQVHLAGTATVSSRAEAEKLFAAKNHTGQVMLHAIRQGEPTNGVEELERTIASTAAELGDGPVPCPPDWGGIDIRPHAVEFWRARKGGLHERKLFQAAEGSWTVTQLAP